MTDDLVTISIRPNEHEPTQFTLPVDSAPPLGAVQHLDEHLALQYLRAHPEAYLRTPAERCERYFDELFAMRFVQRFPGGLELTGDKPVTKKQFAKFVRLADYENVQTWWVEPRTSGRTLIDVLRQFGRQITDELDSYSRFLGRNYSAEGRIRAARLLPQDLFLRSGGRAVDKLLRELSQLLVDGDSAEVKTQTLFRQLDPEDRWLRTYEVNKSDLIEVAETLEMAGYGFEPDPRTSPVIGNFGDYLVLFRLPPQNPSTKYGSHYAIMSVFVLLAAGAATADGEVVNEEIETVASFLDAAAYLSEFERSRLLALLRWATAHPEHRWHKGIAKKMTLERRESLANLLVDVVLSDDKVTKAEVNFVVRCLDTLRLPRDQVVRRLERFGEARTQPADTAPAPVVSTPKSATEDPSAGFSLDRGRIALIRADTREASALLREVFDDRPLEDSTPPVVNPPPPAAPKANHFNLPGVDALHASLIHTLLSQPEWTRSSAAEAANEAGLPFIDGALDTINDACFERFDEPLIEGDDVLEINSYVAKELLP